jgi:addiction module RelB/DinJ family antitoxin
MNSAVINVKTEPEMKIEAQRVAQSMGLSLSTVINRYLKYFVKTKAITFTADEENPSDYLVESLKKSDEDIKSGRVSPSFTNAKDTINWLDEQGI